MKEIVKLKIENNSLILNPNSDIIVMNQGESMKKIVVTMEELSLLQGKSFDVVVLITGKASFEQVEKATDEYIIPSLLKFKGKFYIVRNPELDLKEEN